MTDRKMATVRRIDKIEPIEGADKIVKATVGGWQLVTAIDNGFEEGELVVYCEIDSWIPTEVAPFLSKGKEPREYNGVKGERLRTVKLRGQISQGLLLPLNIANNGILPLEEGMDVTASLNIQKWEAPIPAQLAGQVKGTFPSFIRKTDQERLQNLTKEFDGYKSNRYTWEVTEKLEGSSMTVYYNNGEFGVCSRNMDLKEDPENSFWKVALREMLYEKMIAFGENIALQGELIGPGVQGNIYGLKDHEFRVFDVFSIDDYAYMTSDGRIEIIESFGLKHVPIVGKDSIGDSDTIESLLKYAEGVSALASVEREGLVFKCIESPDISFKTISNKYLLGQE